MNTQNFWKLIDHLRRIPSCEFSHSDPKKCIAGQIPKIETDSVFFNNHMRSGLVWLAKYLDISNEEASKIYWPINAYYELGITVHTPQDAIHLLFKVLGKHLNADESLEDLAKRYINAKRIHQNI